MDALETPSRSAVAESVEAASAVPARLGLDLKTKILYGIGEISNSIKSFTFGLFLLFYYTSVLGMPGTLVGVATALSLIWDAVIDPLIGHLSDRARLRFGRRHPFIFVGAVGMGLGFLLIFSPPSGLSTTGLIAWLIGTNFLLRTMNSVFLIPYHALGAEMSRDYYERTSITSVRAGFGLIGTLIAAGLSFTVFFPNRVPGADPKFNPSGYASMGWVFGLTMALTGLLAGVGTISQRSRAPQVASSIGFLSGLRIALHNSSFLVLTLSTSIFYLASVVNATLGVHYLTYYARILESQDLSLFQASFYLGALGGVLVWLRVAKRMDKHRLYIGAMLILALLMAAAYWLVGETRLFGTGDVLPLAIGNGVGGFFGSALWIVPASMIADVTDQDELATGRRREGVFFGIYSFFLQDAAGLALLTTGLLVDYFAGLQPGQAEQTAQTAHRLGILFSLLPAPMFLVAALLMLGYRLTRQRVETIQRELVHRRIGVADG